MRSNFAALLILTFAGDVVAPIFALYLPLFAFQFGADALEIGLVGGVAWVSYSFVPYLIGRYSDKPRRRKTFIVISMAMLTACSFIYVFVESPLQLIALRLLEGIAWSILWPIVDVSISEDVSRESNKALSIYNTVWSTAGAVGPLLGGLLLLFAEIRYIFLITALLMAIATIVTISFFREEGPTVPITRVSSGDGSANMGRVRSRSYRQDSLFWIFVTAMVLISSIRGVLYTFYPPLAQSQGISYALIALIGFTFGVCRVGVFALSTRDGLRGFLLNDENIKKIVMVSLAVCAIGGVLPLIGDRTGAVGFLAFGVVAFASAFVIIASQANFISQAESHNKGAGAGIFESSIGIGIALGPTIAGFVSGGSISIPFLVAPIGFAISLPILLVLFRRGTNNA
ncbi:MAG: MFS transporter [Thaumarchaeota archaeon]|nr:MFS transporter [Nitrososphaerota archaeon]